MQRGVRRKYGDEVVEKGLECWVILYRSAHLSSLKSRAPYSIPLDIEDSHQAPRVGLFTISLDTAPGGETDTLREDERGERVDVDELFVMREGLAEETLEGDPT